MDVVIHLLTCFFDSFMIEYPTSGTLAPLEIRMFSSLPYFEPWIKEFSLLNVSCSLEVIDDNDKALSSIMLWCGFLAMLALFLLLRCACLVCTTTCRDLTTLLRAITWELAKSLLQCNPMFLMCRCCHHWCKVVWITTRWKPCTSHFN